ncbi:MAG: Txe/YoeB family addiction module toxin [Spirochaetales bacterium]|nr:Txe/YoeB family addiction module toxin [Spirochaetales bacterium]
MPSEYIITLIYFLVQCYNFKTVKKRAQEILRVLEVDPFKEYPPFEKLIGDLTGVFSRRINIQHRIVYQVYQKKQIVKIIRMWTHYE